MLYIVDIESVETRYTKQWKKHVPLLFEKYGVEVCTITGPTDIPRATTPGAFLNFGGTNIYKARQVEEISHMFCEGRVKDGDYFLFTDAWHPGIINLKYMAELLGVKIKIGALWHAGSYDPQDFLGRLIGDEPWVRHAEKAMFHAIDHNYFATNFHIKMFLENLLGEDAVSGRKHYVPSGKIVRTGWPMEYIETDLEPYKGVEKQDIILFPHRIAPEKNPEIFRALAKELPEYQFIMCQNFSLSKDEYHKLLAKSKIVFSANTQETLGISVYEGAILDCVPLMPDRLSYTEMWSDDFKYPSEWASDMESYEQHKDAIINRIRDIMSNHESYTNKLKPEIPRLYDFYHGEKLVNTVRRHLI